MARIKKLSKNLINQIAAGEVIERPCSVVKELVENSIDAGATKIEIAISNECRNIRIADNGTGIHPDDIELAFTNHATSKLEDENSLFNIHTLGFRGEALASIISIAKVSCITRTKDFEYGTKVESKDSEITKSQIGCAQGTIFEVTDIFYNQPARLKFLKSAKTEFSYIQELVMTIALSHPEIAFTLKNNNQNVLSTTQNDDLLTRISEIYSNDVADELNTVRKQDTSSNLEISGYTSVPSYTRSSKKSIYTFVNSRMVKCPVLLKAIDLAYKNTMPNGKYPFVVINLDIPTEDIDVNAHPTKREIRYKNPNQIFNFVQSAISQAISGYEYKTSEPEQSKVNLFDYSVKSQDDDSVYINDIKLVDKPFETISKPVEKVLPKFENHVQSTMNFEFDLPKETEKINIIGQFANTYILVENENGLEIIDQHIADERYIYEKLKSEQKIASQLILISEPIEVSPSESDLIINASDTLEKFGYKIEVQSPTKVVFKKIPQVLSYKAMNDILSELLNNLKDSESNKNINTLEEKILITTSCKAAVKAGAPLNLIQMEEIVRRLRETKNPFTCPHGRTISHIIAQKDVAAFFGRQK